MELAESPALRQNQQQQIMVNMQVGPSNQASDANEDFQPSDLVTSEAQLAQQIEPELNKKPLQRDLSHLDTDSVIYFNEAIFTIRCTSTASMPINEHLLNQIRVKNQLFDNPGSYPTLYNEVDSISHYQAFHTNSKAAYLMSTTILS